MKTIKLTFKEIAYRKWNFILGLASIVAVIGVLVGAQAMLKAHDYATQSILTEKEAKTAALMAQMKEEMRVATLKLGLNLAILPKDQSLNDWYADDFGTKYLDESVVEKLADSGVVTVRHFLPILQQKVKWPEMKRTIILVGTRGEVPNLHKSPKEPLVQAVPAGKIVLGHELHRSLGLAPGERVSLLGEEFVVHKCHEERGSKDDITAWIPLARAQEMLSKPGKINAILALNCLCKGRDLALMRSEIAGAVPGVQVIELGTEKALARAEARFSAGRTARAALEDEKRLRGAMRDQRERFATILVMVMLGATVAWIGFLSWTNVRERRYEIGVMRAIGYKTLKIMNLFVIRAVLMGIAGGMAGAAVGVMLGKYWFGMVESQAVAVAVGRLVDPGMLAAAIVLAPVLAVIGGWLPIMLAINQDPATVLRKE